MNRGAGGRAHVTLQADGSALYTVQGLWTQARAKLDVTMRSVRTPGPFLIEQVAQ